MNNKIITLILVFHCHALMSMEKELQKDCIFHQQLDLSAQIKKFPLEIQQKIIHFAAPKQWWYLDKTFEHRSGFFSNHSVNSANFDPSGKLLATVCGEAAYVTDIQSQKQLFSKSCKTLRDRDDYAWIASTINKIYFCTSGEIFAIDYYHYEKKIAICDMKLKKSIDTFEDFCKIGDCIIDPSGKYIVKYDARELNIFTIKTKERFFLFEPNCKIHSVFFNSSGNLLIIEDKTSIHIIDMQKQSISSCVKQTKNIHSICFDHSSTLFVKVVTSQTPNLSNTELNSSDITRPLYNTSSNIIIHNMNSKEQVASFTQDDLARSLCFDSSGQFLAIASNNQAYIFDINLHTKVASFNHDQWVHSVDIDPSGKLLVTASADKARIFARYDNYTEEQLRLKYALLSWPLIEKPNKSINTIYKLLTDIAQKYECSYDELHKTWTTFPQNMQNALWKTMQYKINTYGKYTDSDYDIVGCRMPYCTIQ